MAVARAPLTCLLALTLLCVSVAGCLDKQPATPSPPPRNPGDDARVLEDPLAAWAAGNQSANLDRVGEWRNGGGQEADAWSHYLAVDRGSQVDILDISNVVAPERVATVQDFGGSVLDVKWTDDGAWMIIGDDAEGGGTPLDGTGPMTGGFYVFDTSDPEAPALASFLGVGPRRGPHMVATLTTDELGTLVFGANADISINQLDETTGALTPLSRYTPLLTDWNRDPEVFDVLYQGWAHDMFPLSDPENGALLFVANWDAGLRIVDINDPANPVELGAWMDFPSGHEGNLHTVAAAWIDDRRIVVGSTEVGFAVVGGTHYAQGTDRSIVYVWDATDLTKPTLLGWWENPDHAPSGRDNVPGETVTSTHNLQLVNGRVYLAHYALGVWVLDIASPALQAKPGTLAYYLEDGQDTWDVVLHQGILWTSGTEGVLGLHYPADELGPNGPTGSA